jgi:hypothetical protein
MDFIPELVLKSAENSQHKIPHHLIFTYETSLLEDKVPDKIYQNVMHTIDSYRNAWNETEAPVWFLTNPECQQVIEATYPRILPIFRNETKGMFKGDICRVAALYLTGGYYFDVDLRVVEPIPMDPQVQFSSVLFPPPPGENRSLFFQAFVAIEPRHPLMLTTMDTMMDFYETQMNANETLMGTKTMRTAYDMLLSEDKIGEHYLLQETNMLDRKNMYPHLKQKNGWGYVCYYIVHDAEKQVAYFFSRIVGSRLCHK